MQNHGLITPLTWIQIRFPERRLGPYSTIIQDITDEAFLVDAPYEQGRIVAAYPGERVVCNVVYQDTYYEFQTQVIRYKRQGKLILVALSKPSTLIQVQRRRFYRLEINLPVRFILHQDLEGHEAYSLHNARTGNVGGAGISIITDLNIPENATMDIVLQLPKREESPAEDIPCEGKVVSVRPIGDRWKYGIEFTQIQRQHRERIAQFVLQEQARMRRKR